LRSLFADRLLRVLHQIECRLERKLLAANPKTKARDRLIKQSIPGRVGRHRLFMKQLLDPILELIWFLATDILKPGSIVRERSLAHGRLQDIVFDAVELQREEQQMRGSRGDPLLHITIKFGARRITGVTRIDETRIGDEPTNQVVDRLVAFDRIGETGAGLRSARQSCELSFELIFKGNRICIGALKIAPHLRCIHGRVEISQIPFRQRAEFGARIFW